MERSPKPGQDGPVQAPSNSPSPVSVTSNQSCFYDASLVTAQQHHHQQDAAPALHLMDWSQLSTTSMLWGGSWPFPSGLQQQQQHHHHNHQSSVPQLPACGFAGITQRLGWPWPAPLHSKLHAGLPSLLPLDCGSTQGGAGQGEGGDTAGEEGGFGLWLRHLQPCLTAQQPLPQPKQPAAGLQQQAEHTGCAPPQLADPVQVPLPMGAQHAASREQATVGGAGQGLAPAVPSQPHPHVSTSLSSSLHAGLRGLHHLRELSLEGAALLEDEGLAACRLLPALEVLRLGGCRWAVGAWRWAAARTHRQCNGTVLSLLKAFLAVLHKLWHIHLQDVCSNPLYRGREQLSTLARRGSWRWFTASCPLQIMDAHNDEPHRSWVHAHARVCLRSRLTCIRTHMHARLHPCQGLPAKEQPCWSPC